MAELDEARDTIHAIVQGVAERIAELKDRPGNDHNAPGFLQAAFVFAEIIIPNRNEAFASDELHAIAVELRDRCRGQSWAFLSGDTFANQIHQWVEWADGIRADDEDEIEWSEASNGH